MAKRRLVPAAGFGQSLYDCIKSQRRADGTAWEAEDLAERLADQGVPVSAKQVREWVKGTKPRLDTAIAIAQIFGTTADEMWRGTAKPINLPQDRAKPAGDSAGQGRRQLAEVRKAGRRRRRGRTG